MSLNHRGQITGQVVHPLVALSDRKQKRHLTHPHPPPPAGDIIEISSDEDEDPQPPPKKVLINIEHPSSTHEPDYKARLFQKDREIENLKKREKELERTVARQKRELEAKESQDIPKADEVEDELSCDICAIRMWAPYRLMECGHVFCLGCLLNWFDETHVRFLDSHPGYAPPTAYLRMVLQRPLEFPQECYKALMHMAQFPGPEYTCPSCRTAVTRRPVEDFKLKALVSWLSSVQGVKPPKPIVPPGTGDAVFNGYSLL